ncbi:MAG: hypothetical protein J1F32_03390 [Erysipelotrichales bacterium]|nr:hypothetical protein [Erysipelotrichales bacterium]
MEYQRVILELMERVAELEERVTFLENIGVDMKKKAKPIRGTYTSEVIDYIKNSIESAKKKGMNSITLISGNVQKNVGLKNRLPLVCNAMRKCMDEKSEIIFETPSGQSSTLTIKWNF